MVMMASVDSMDPVTPVASVIGSAETKERKARAALQELGAEIADRCASALEQRPTMQLALQKLIDPIVRHILNTIFPWVVGVAVLFLILLICTVVTCVIVLRSAPGTTYTVSK
jgi:hypothetical protein